MSRLSIMTAGTLCACLLLLAGLHVRFLWADRIGVPERESALRTVRDQVLRYEDERGRLPASLDDLVPRYLRADQIESGGQPLFAYDAGARTLAEARAALLDGRFTSRAEVLSTTLPQPEAPPPAEPAGAPASPGVEPPPAGGPGKGPPAARLVLPKGPDLRPPPEGSYVFEAEHFSETNYGWEVHADPSCSGGAYLHCKEGTGNGPGQKSYGIREFYNVKGSKDFTMIRHRFNLEAGGSYYVYGRFWTTDTHCSNNICVAVDKGGPYVGGMGNRTPFRWVWSPMRDNPVWLEAGDHFLHAFMHEDGIRIDQFILSPVPVSGGEACRPNMRTGEGTAWQASLEAPVHISFDLKSIVIDPELPPVCNLVLRRLRPAKGTATARVRILGVAPGGGDLTVAEKAVELARLPEVAFMPLDFEGLDLKGIARREYVMEAELDLTGKKLASIRVPLMRPFAWEVFGPGGFLSNDTAGPLDGDEEPAPGDSRRWTPFDVRNWDHYGVLDFGLQTIGNSLHAPQQKTIYARTRVKVPRAGDYLLKIQSDDQMLLWLDGKPIYRHDYTRPVTRATKELKARLEAGVHRFRMRVNQGEGRWQASLRVRTAGDWVSEVTGLEIGEDTGGERP